MGACVCVFRRWSGCGCGCVCVHAGVAVCTGVGASRCVSGLGRVERVGVGGLCGREVLGFFCFSFFFQFLVFFLKNFFS